MGVCLTLKSERAACFSSAHARATNLEAMDKPKHLIDTYQPATLIADISAGEVERIKEENAKNPEAVALGRKGGLRGGKARAKALTAQERSEIARKAAKRRWEAVSARREASVFPCQQSRKSLSVDSD